MNSLIMNFFQTLLNILCDGGCQWRTGTHARAGSYIDKVLKVAEEKGEALFGGEHTKDNPVGWPRATPFQSLVCMSACK